MISKYKNRIVLGLIMFGLFRAGMYGFDYFRPVDFETSAGAKTSISAEDIERILELNGATVKVTVTTDTSYVSISVPSFFGVNVSFLEKESLHRLTESRSWLIKAGTADFSLHDSPKGHVLELAKPSVTTREHITEEYSVKKRTGVWNPVTLKQLELSSRQKATAAAIEKGLLTEAALSIENALYEILPPNVEIAWKQ